MDGVFSVVCSGYQWTMTIYPPGAACQGTPVDTLVGDFDCAGNIRINCNFVVAAGSGALASASLSAAAVAVNALVAWFLLRPRV